MRSRIYHLIAILGLSSTACGGEDPTPPPRVADRITIASGDNQEAQVGAPVANPITLIVGDQQGPLAGVPVTFSVSEQGGFVSANADTSDAAGIVSVTWVLGGQLGTQSLTATAAGIAPTTVRATARIGPLALLSPVSSPSQFVVVGQAVASVPVIKASDAFGNPIAGQEITFVDATGRSVVVGGTATTNAAGLAGVTSWTIAREPGSYTLQARGPSFTTTNFVAFGVPAQVEISAGDNQTANAGTLVNNPPSVRTLDDLNQPLAGVSVTFTVSSGGGRVNGTPTVRTNSAGIAAAPGWVLGPTPGANELSVEIPGVSSPKFSATGVAAVAAAIEATIPTGQAGLAGNFGSARPSVRVTDAAGRPVAGETVTFTITAGDGRLSATTPKTDFNGDAALGSWRFGTGAQAVTARVAAIPPVTFTATTQAPPASGYAIDVRFLGPTPSTSQKAAFDSAAARWSMLILSDLDDVPFTSADDLSFCGGSTLEESVDDLVIFAKIDKIDGPGGILGQAGACYLRDDNLLSVVGIMQFDVDDVVNLESSGRFRDVVLHEMGHVIGIGSLWNLKELVTGRGTGDPIFTGPSGRMAFAASLASPAAFTGTAVPVENVGGGGTRDVHWREAVLNNELMTGFLNSGTNPLSALTAASLRDEGYLVNDAVSDPFSLGAALQAAAAAPLNLHLVPWNTVVRTIDRAGRVRRTVDLRDGPFKR